MIEIVGRILERDFRAIARLITWIENDDPRAWEVLADLYPHTGRAYLVGVTGFPGVGKSTLVGQLASLYRREGKTVGIIAVDPTSPFSRGAVLGDRVRMSNLTGDPGVYIRSMATRGSLGGIALATSDACAVLDAAGFEVILVETVGTGQAEVEIIKIVNTAVVVTAPGLGDGIQAIKAGIMEIADVFVVNKADRPGANQVAAILESTLSLGLSSGWRPLVCKASAIQGEGTASVVEAIERHRQYLAESGEGEKRERSRVEAALRQAIAFELTARFFSSVDREVWEALVTLAVRRELDPHKIVHLLLGEKTEAPT